MGESCSNKIVHIAWVAARTKAQAAFGDKFSVPWFHGILEEGTMPLFMLEKRIQQRTAERLAAG